MAIPNPPPYSTYGRPPAPPKKPFPWVIAVIGCGGVCCLGTIVLAAILFPVFASARQVAKQSLALSNVKVIGISCLIYAGDHDDLLPMANNWQTVTSPYVTEQKKRALDDAMGESSPKNKSLYSNSDEIYRSIIPSGSGGTYIAFRSKLAAKNSVTLDAAPRTVMVFDSTITTPNAHGDLNLMPSPGRWNKKNLMAMADGSARAVTPEYGYK